MKQTVLKQPVKTVKRSLFVKTALCILAVVLTLACNLVLALTASDGTNALFCFLNIITDIVCGIFVIWFVSVKILPERVLCRFAEKPMTEYSGEVREQSEKTVRYMDMDCYELAVNDRKLFLPVSSARLQTGETYRFRLVSNVIMEAER